MKSVPSAPPLQSFGRELKTCRMCGGKDLKLVLDLGHQPHSDSFPTREQLNEAEAHYPLRLLACATCGLLQIDYLVNPSILYQQDYLYVSSTTATGRKHFGDMAKAVAERSALAAGSLVVDIGSNVGLLLEAFKALGMKVLGVDPAPIPAKQALQNGIDTVVDFFASHVAEKIRATHGEASVITGTNVFAHMHELGDFIAGVKALLAKDGTLVIEAPHALTMIENLEYDTIYHQHVSYLSARPMKDYFKQVGLELFSVETLPIHGGSLRYFAGFPGKHPVEPVVQELIQKEETSGLYDLARLAQFAREVVGQKRALVALLLGFKKQGKRIVALSAPAKGNTLLNYCHLDASIIDYATERNPLKIGRFTPGTHLPIYADEKILSDTPDYALILAWNFADEIMRNMELFKKGGGQFVLPIPRPTII